MPAPPPPCGFGSWPPCSSPPQPADEVNAYALQVIDWYETPEGRAEVEELRKSKVRG